MICSYLTERKKQCHLKSRKGFQNSRWLAKCHLMSSWKQNRKVRIGVILLLFSLLCLWYFRKDSRSIVLPDGGSFVFIDAANGPSDEIFFGTPWKKSVCKLLGTKSSMATGGFFFKVSDWNTNAISAITIHDNSALPQHSTLFSLIDSTRTEHMGESGTTMHIPKLVGGYDEFRFVYFRKPITRPAQIRLRTTFPDGSIVTNTFNLNK